LTLAAKSQRSENEDSNGRKDSPEQEAEGISRDFKSEVAAYMVASTVTSVVASWQANLFFEPTKFEVRTKNNIYGMDR